MSDRYVIYTRPVQDSDFDYSNYEAAGDPIVNWHWKLTRGAITVASGFASSRHRARSKAEKAAKKDSKRRADAADPKRQEEAYAYEPE